MKTRELTGWSYNENIEDFEKGQGPLRIFIRTPGNFSEINASMVKAIIEVPERKVTISESEFEEAVNESPLQYDYAVKYLKQKLFGEEK